MLNEALYLGFGQKGVFVIRKKSQGLSNIFKGIFVLFYFFPGQSPAAKGLKGQILVLADFFKDLHILYHFRAVLDGLFVSSKLNKGQGTVSVNRFYILYLIYY